MPIKSLQAVESMSQPPTAALTDSSSLSKTYSNTMTFSVPSNAVKDRTLEAMTALLYIAQVCHIVPGQQDISCNTFLTHIQAIHFLANFGGKLFSQSLCIGKIF